MKNTVMFSKVAVLTALVFASLSVAHADEFRIGSSAHWSGVGEDVVFTGDTRGPVDCDIQSPSFAQCLSAHAPQLVKLPEPEATHVKIDADGTVHLLSQ